MADASGQSAESVAQPGILGQSAQSGTAPLSPQLATLIQQVIDGDTAAMFILANIRLVGNAEVEKDVAEAIGLYEQVVVAGGDACMDAAVCLADLAAQLYEEAANEGNTDAMVKLGDMLEYGGQGVAQDKARAAKLYERAASFGNEDAMLRLGAFLEYGGLGMAKDEARAAKLYERAASFGNEDAMFKLGALLAYGGQGMAQDKARAAKLYEEAASLGNEDAIMESEDLWEDRR